MNGLNYHHLRYFHAVAKEGSLAAAAARLRVSAPAISEQVRELETTLGERLFRREGRGNRLTATGEQVFSYAEEIFALGAELISTVKQQPGTRPLRLHAGVVDSFPKILTLELFQPVLDASPDTRLICQEGRLEELLVQLNAHRLDIVLADEPAFSTTHPHITSHLLGTSDVTFCARPDLAAQLRGNFPRALHTAAALVPAARTPFRRALETWFRAHRVQPRVVAECDDLALLKVLAADGRGFIPMPTVAAEEAMRRYGLAVVGCARRCTVSFHALTANRREMHPAVTLLTNSAQRDLFP
ncbi:MAG: LysR family transcriptional regulator [Verrucomicrobia bacterium]|nr:LysR family transcriptional regulator [Verrucomicrobiota bacterium]